jgi:hypothetical protein
MLLRVRCCPLCVGYVSLALFFCVRGPVERALFACMCLHVLWACARVRVWRARGRVRQGCAYPSFPRPLPFLCTCRVADTACCAKATTSPLPPPPPPYTPACAVPEASTPDACITRALVPLASAAGATPSTSQSPADPAATFEKPTAAEGAPGLVAAFESLQARSHDGRVVRHRPVSNLTIPANRPGQEALMVDIVLQGRTSTRAGSMNAAAGLRDLVAWLRARDPSLDPEGRTPQGVFNWPPSEAGFVELILHVRRGCSSHDACRARLAQMCLQAARVQQAERRHAGGAVPTVAALDARKLHHRVYNATLNMIRRHAGRGKVRGRSWVLPTT